MSTKKTNPNPPAKRVEQKVVSLLQKKQEKMIDLQKMLHQILTIILLQKKREKMRDLKKMLHLNHQVIFPMIKILFVNQILLLHQMLVVK